MNLSIIIPVKDEEENIFKIVKEIKESLSDINYEIIFIDDGSIDNTFNNIEKACKSDKKIKMLSFSRNFGKDAAIYAGLKASSGNYTAIIDGDLQQDPKLLKEMYIFLSENAEYDQIAMVIRKRKYTFFLKRIFSNLFYKIINKISYIGFASNASDFRMFRKNVKEAILSLPEKRRFTKGIFNWIGFNTYYKEYDVLKRKNGKTKFSLRKSYKYAINGIVSYSEKPLVLSAYFGIFISTASFIYLFYIVFKTLFFGKDTPGFATIVCLILFIGGIQLISIGILGKYISELFIESKQRPIYILKKQIGFEKEEL